MNFPLDTSTKRFTPCVIICPCDKWLPQQKEDRKIDESEYLKRIEENMEEENEKTRGRDWRAGHFSRGEILRGG